jgi:hypothetical protein
MRPMHANRWFGWKGCAMPLEDYYAGDGAFHDFAVACASAWESSTCQAALLRETGGDLDLAMALHYRRGNGARDWIDLAIPALDHLTPRQCLLTDAGRRRLKECLLRMP